MGWEVLDPASLGIVKESVILSLAPRPAWQLGKARAIIPILCVGSLATLTITEVGCGLGPRRMDSE